MKLTKRIISISAAVLAAGALSVSAFAANNAMNKAAASSSWHEYSFDFSGTNYPYRRTSSLYYKNKSDGGWAYGTAEHGTFGPNMPVTFYVLNQNAESVTKYPETLYGVGSFELEYSNNFSKGNVRLCGETQGTYATSTIVSGDWKP